MNFLNTILENGNPLEEKYVLIDNNGISEGGVPLEEKYIKVNNTGIKENGTSLANKYLKINNTGIMENGVPLEEKYIQLDNNMIKEDGVPLESKYIKINNNGILENGTSLESKYAKKTDLNNYTPKVLWESNNVTVTASTWQTVRILRPPDISKLYLLICNVKNCEGVRLYDTYWGSIKAIDYDTSQSYHSICLMIQGPVFTTEENYIQVYSNIGNAYYEIFLIPLSNGSSIPF